MVGVKSDSSLSQSAQVRATLQAKTFLQTLSPDEKRRLLKNTKTSGHRRRHISTALEAATARRDELQQLLAQDKDRFIQEQATLAQQAEVTYSSSPAGDENAAWETARLRVRATSLAAENDALKGHVQQLMHQLASMDKSVQVVSNEARARSQRMTEAAAARIAELEDQVERQQQVLSEMAKASEDLAGNNCAASQELVQLREDKASQAQDLELLQDRVAKLQELYMRDSRQRDAQVTVHENIQQQHLLQLATPELLAISQPPADFAIPEHSKAMRIVPALHEIEALRRERDAAREQAKVCVEKLTRAEDDRVQLSNAIVSERKAAKQAGAGAQKQLLGSVRRIQYLVDQIKESKAHLQQKDAYIQKLEGRLLAQHKAAPAAVRGPTSGSKGKTSGTLSSRQPPSNASAASIKKHTPQMQDVHPGRSQPQQPNSSTPACAQLSYHTEAQPLQDASNLPHHTGTSAGLPRQHHAVPNYYHALNQLQAGSSAQELAYSCDLPHTDSAALLKGEPGTGASQQRSNSVAQHARGPPQHVQQQHQDQQHTCLVARQDDSEAGFSHELDSASNEEAAEGTDDWADAVSLDSGWPPGKNKAEEQLADAAEARLLAIIAHKAQAHQHVKPCTAGQSTRQGKSSRHTAAGSSTDSGADLSDSSSRRSRSLQQAAMTGAQQSSSSSAVSTSSSLAGLSARQRTDMTTMTANDCFDGSILFGDAFSTAVTPGTNGDRVVSALQPLQTANATQLSVQPVRDCHDGAAGNLEGDAMPLPRTEDLAPDPQAYRKAPHAEASSSHGSAHATQAASPQSESQGEVMTLEELEARIASLNQTLLSAPVDSGPHRPPMFAMRPSSAHSRRHYSPRSRAHSPHCSPGLPVRSAHDRPPQPAAQMRGADSADLSAEQHGAATSISTLGALNSQLPAACAAERHAVRHDSAHREHAGKQCSLALDERMQMPQGRHAMSAGAQGVKPGRLQRHGLSPARQQALLDQSPNAAAALRKLRGQQSSQQQHHSQFAMPVQPKRSGSSLQQEADTQQTGIQTHRFLLAAQQQSGRTQQVRLQDDIHQSQQRSKHGHDGAAHRASPRAVSSTDTGHAEGVAGSPPAQAAPVLLATLESPPSTGMRHYSGASRPRRQSWGDSEGRLLNWAESCPAGDDELEAAP